MVTSDVTALGRSDLNPFLFADIGTEANGMMLNVMSVLARQGNDPWREAGRLADLPKAEAADSLARAIAGTPMSLWSLADAAKIAAGLTSLLPPRPGPGIARIAGRRSFSWNTVALACIAIALAAAIVPLLWSSSSSRSGDNAAPPFASAAPSGKQ